MIISIEAELNPFRNLSKEKVLYFQVKMVEWTYKCKDFISSYILNKRSKQ